ncbi:MAG: 30S ribosomal protein S4e [Candidatus Micrarchaeota archaeon]|nr:30S ribosomal protein S4e [Candidatus Micrarchaeota archaeon]
MARKGGSLQQTRISAHKTLMIKRKEYEWTVKPGPGPHKASESVPALIILRDYLNLVDNAKEARSVLNAGGLILNGKKTKRLNALIGLMDILQLPAIGKSYTAVIDNKARLKLVEIGAVRSKTKLCRIERKVTTKGAKLTLGCHDGRTLAGDNTYRVGDTVEVALDAPKILSVFRFGKDARCLIRSGKHAGIIGRIKELRPGSANRRAEAVITPESGGKEIITLRSYLFVVPDDYAME